MSAVGLVAAKAGRARQIAGAFLRMDLINAVSYPLALIMNQAQAIAGVVIWFFVANFTAQGGPAVGGDYFTYVVIALITVRLLSGALQGFSSELGRIIEEGRLEMVLVEPIRWRIIPFAMGQWQLVLSSTVAGVMALLSLALGATYRIQGLPLALLVLALGVAATFAVGVLSASVKVLSKRSDPVLAIYQLAALVFSGVFYSIDVLPPVVRFVSYAIPHTYVIAALRQVLMPAGGTLPGLSAGEAVALLAIFCAVVYPLSLWLYGRSMDYGRKMGLLGSY